MAVSDLHGKEGEKRELVCYTMHELRKLKKTTALSWYGIMMFDVCHNVLVLSGRMMIKLELMLSSHGGSGELTSGIFLHDSSPPMCILWLDVKIRYLSSLCSDLFRLSVRRD